MSKLPSSQTPLNQHSLGALELWLMNLGAERSNENQCLWRWILPQWSADIYIKEDELIVIWTKVDRDPGKQTSQLSFPYGLPRQDVEAALKQGP